MPPPPATGLLVLHGNRVEMLAAAVLAWLARHPLAPLEDEVFLVQSNGMAEWLKMEIASAQGICAATRVELPARFVWRAYRAVLGSEAVPRVSPLDKLPLTWRLMALLPRLAHGAGFEPVAAFLGAGDDAGRRLQLARRLADLLDQYQVYRGDWLQDWAAGDDRLRTGAGTAIAVPPDQRWQPALWRAVLATLSEAERGASRPALHQRFLQALRPGAGQPPSAPGLARLPRRVVLFGTTHLPQQMLEAIAALAAHCQVLMAVPNPCRYHWADIIEGRELLHAQRRRQALRPGPGPDPATLPLQDLHAHGHPLLAAWGRQARDFVRQLDAFDDAAAARQRFGLPRIDLFDEAPGRTQLQQVQAAVRDLLPLAEQPRPPLADDDRSIVFHVAHSAHREVEVLHDQLLHLFAQAPAEQPLQPRDVVVMVPDIEVFAPAIRAVFGQHARGQPRHIPWGIADQADRGQRPLLVALEWLLRAPQQRFGASELRDLLDVPAVARRRRLADDALPTLVAWIEGAGIRWGLDGAQRRSLGLAAAGEHNTWAFGLRRMLLGYATGALEQADGFDGIEPYAEVAGLSAGLAGALAELLHELTAWWAESAAARSPAGWAERLRALLAAFFEASDDEERALLAALDEALADWLQACERAGFTDAVDLGVVREAWLGALDEPGGARRFRAGGVTFCTLLPMRAIPFEVVALLGMNDGDYPRRGTRNDFDLMALPGQARPGDRSRRHDDRQLMLDALLSARRVLYLSWAGRSQRDNQVQPPSVLVGQLRDHLAAVWGAAALAQRTTEHPLQPFSRRYFEPADERGRPGRLFTYAGEWRAAHVDAAAEPAAPTSMSTERAGAAPAVLSLASLAAFVRNPVQAFFRHRLQVSFDERGAAVQDDEPFDSRGLARWALLDEVLGAAQRAQATAAADPADLPALVRARLAALRRAGRLPLGGPGQAAEAELAQALQPMLQRWQDALAQHPVRRGKLPLRWPAVAAGGAGDAPVLDDWLVGLRAAAATGPGVWIELQASAVATAGGKGGRASKGGTGGTGGPQPRADKLVTAWLRCLAAAACGHAAEGVVIGPGALVQVTAPPPHEAAATLHGLLQACADGLGGTQPLPTAVRTGLAWLREPGKARSAYEGSDFSPLPGEGREPCLARLYPDFATLSAQPGFEPASQRLYAPLQHWLDHHVTATLTDSAPGAGDE